MEVILLEDVKTLGKKGEIVKVNEGYARNYILPKKLGLEANNKNLNDLKLQKAREAKLAKEELEAAKELARHIETLTVETTIKTGEGGKTFGSVSSKEIVEACKKQHGLEIDKKKIVIDGEIRSLGTHIVSVKLHREVTANLKVHVNAK